jgi:hypothetical protein
MFHGHGNQFCAHLIVLLGDVCQVEAHFVLFGDSINIAQDKCMVYAECTIGMENFSGTPDGISP